MAALTNAATDRPCFDYLEWRLRLSVEITISNRDGIRA